MLKKPNSGKTKPIFTLYQRQATRRSFLSRLAWKMLKSDADYLNHTSSESSANELRRRAIIIIFHAKRITALCHRARAWPREKCMLSSDAWCLVCVCQFFWHLYGAAATIIVARRAYKGGHVAIVANNNTKSSARIK